jgi:cbb3-type cytochrome oxidase subunit 3
MFVSFKLSMLTNEFQKLLTVLFALLFLGLIAYALYCKHKMNSYIGTGRVNDIEIWWLKSAVSWIATFALTIMLILHLA